MLDVLEPHQPTFDREVGAGSRRVTADEDVSRHNIAHSSHVNRDGGHILISVEVKHCAIGHAFYPPHCLDAAHVKVEVNHLTQRKACLRNVAPRYRRITDKANPALFVVPHGSCSSAERDDVEFDLVHVEVCAINVDQLELPVPGCEPSAELTHMLAGGISGTRRRFEPMLTQLATRHRMHAQNQTARRGVADVRGLHALHHGGTEIKHHGLEGRGDRLTVIALRTQLVQTALASDDVATGEL